MVVLWLQCVLKEILFVVMRPRLFKQFFVRSRGIVVVFALASGGLVVRFPGGGGVASLSALGDFVRGDASSPFQRILGALKVLSVVVFALASGGLVVMVRFPRGGVLASMSAHEDLGCGDASSPVQSILGTLTVLTVVMIALASGGLVVRFPSGGDVASMDAQGDVVRGDASSPVQSTLGALLALIVVVFAVASGGLVVRSPCWVAECDELNGCALFYKPESSEFNACSGLYGLDKSLAGRSTATALGHPAQMTAGVQN